MTPPTSGPAPIEPSTPPNGAETLPGLESVSGDFLPPEPTFSPDPIVPPGDDVGAASTAASSAVPSQPVEPALTDDGEAREKPQPAAGQPAPLPSASLDELLEAHQRILRHLATVERRQRAAEKNILILAAALACVLWQLRKPPKPVELTSELAAVPDLPPLDVS